jgi:hypothetical protein
MDMDVSSRSEQVFAVRYSHAFALLALGCQRLPDRITKDDVDSLRYIKHPVPELRYLISKSRISQAQDPVSSRRMIRMMRGQVPDLPSSVPLESMSAGLGGGTGLTLDRAAAIISMFKSHAADSGIEYGVPLVGGGRYVGSVVEMCGFEDSSRRTSKAAARFSRLIASV